MVPKISIIIPVKNEEKCLEKTLKQYLSIKKKFGIEVITSDGGSTDKTIEIARKYADKCILRKRGKKQTIAAGRNAGSRIAKGKILIHTDADVIIPDKERFFKRVNDLFKNKKIIAATPKLRIYPEEERISDKIGHFFINFTMRIANMFFPFLGKGECQIVRTSSFNKVGGYKETLVMGEDSNLFYRLRRIGRIAYLNDLVIYHSPRRFRKEGYIRLLLIFSFEGLYLILSGKPFLREWKQVR